MKIFALFLSVLACGLLLAADEPKPAKVDAALAERIEKLIRQLDADQFDLREAASRELKQIGPAAEPALRAALEGKPSLEVQRRIEVVLSVVAQRFPAEANGWSWIYGGICHGQSFQATGGAVKELRIRAAKLNDTAPAAPLEVEVRDPSLEKVFLRGVVPVAEAEREFHWRTVRLDHRADLKAGQSYILLFHSQDTSNKAPWVVNEIYADVYPHGHHLGYQFDFFFSIAFEDGQHIHVGPGVKTEQKLPINSGAAGGGPYPPPVNLVGGGKLPEGKLVEKAKR